MPETTERRRLHEHLRDALDAFCDEEAQRYPHLRPVIDAVPYSELMQYLEWEALGRQNTRSGRIDTRSLRWRFYLRNPLGIGPRIVLCEVRGDQLIDADGQPIDARADVRALLQQQGQRIPDSPAGIEHAPPSERRNPDDGA